MRSKIDELNGIIKYQNEILNKIEIKIKDKNKLISFFEDKLDKDN